MADQRVTNLYLARSAAQDVAKWLAKESSWCTKVALHQLDPVRNPLNVRSMPSKKAKWEAYSRGSQLAHFLKEPSPRSAADLGWLVGLAFAYRGES